MKEIGSIVFVNFILLPLVINANLKHSNELLCARTNQKNIFLSDRVRRILLLRSIAKSCVSKVNIQGFVHYLLVTYPLIWFAAIIVIFSFVQIIKCVFDLNFVWFTTAILVLSGFWLTGYSTFLFALFEVFSWISKKKGFHL